MAFLFCVPAAFAAPRHALSPHHVPAATTGLTPLHRLAATQRLTLEIGLPLRNSDSFSQLLEQIYDPASTNYHHYLTAQQFTEQFGPATSDYQALIAFAQAHGLTVTKTFPDSTLLVVNGAVTDIEKTFHVNLHAYAHPNEARAFFAPDAEPLLDLNIAVLDIAGLDNFVRPHPMNLKHVSPAARAANPQAFTGSQNGLFIGNDFRAAYVPGTALTGAGQTVGLLEFDGYYIADITTYKSIANLPDVPIVTVPNTNNFDGAPSANNIEVALDIEMAISMAPGLSQVIVYEGSSPNTIFTQIANDQQANQISASWTYGVNSSTTNLLHRLALQGQTFLNASGDSGAYNSTPATPTDDPYITVVGGTTLTTTGPGGTWSSEKVWSWFMTGEGTAASSGGISTKYHTPTWQAGVSMANNQGSTTFRTLPDVALTADNIFVVYDNGSQGEVGGTSAAAPLWAGFVALINQQAAANGETNAGFLNPAVYAIGKGSSYSSAFHDITVGNNTNATVTNKFSAVAGYDLCTGWGTPVGTALINLLAPPAMPFVSSQPPGRTVIAGNSTTFTIGAVSSAALAYQWRFNTTNISGATASSYTIANVQPANQGNYSVIVSNSFGTTNSAVAALTVIVTPIITTQPHGTNISPGGTATFTVAATGTPTPFYIWRFNGTNITTTTSSSFLVANVQPSEQGNYSVIVSNSAGAVTSSNAALVLNTPPAIVAQPQALSLNVGSTANFGVFVTGSAPLNFQWLFNTNSLTNSARIIGSLTTNLTITNILASDAGSYQVIVTNVFGASTSAVATLSVTGVPPSFASTPGSAQYSNGQFRLQLSNLTGQGAIIIQSSTNFIQWTSIFTNPSTFGQFQFTDTNAASNTATFYRALTTGQ